MTVTRPDLTGVAPEVVAYIEMLEAEVARQRRSVPSPRPGAAAEAEPAASATLPPSEPPTTANVITATARGMIKRTPRHLYGRQHRGGMGIFDLDTDEADPPVHLLIADLAQTLIIITDQGRAFPLPVGQLPESPVRAKGQPLAGRFPLQPDERVAVICPDLGAGYLTLVTRRGQVRRWRYNVFGRNLQPGTLLYDVREGGAPAAVCWTAADADLLIVTASGNAIRFAESQVPVRGCLGIRLTPPDVVVGVAGVREETAVFLLAADGKGAIRQMSGFARNKEPGSGGKLAMKADRLVAAAAVSGGADLFIISRLSKIIRFAADEVPARESAVQGVNCMELRGDETTALAVSG